MRLSVLLFCISMAMTLTAIVACSKPVATTPAPSATSAAKPTQPSSIPSTGPSPSSVSPATQTTAPDIKLKVTSSRGPLYQARVTIERIMSITKERYPGKITFEYYPGDSLMNDKDAFTAVRKKTIDMAMANASQWPEIGGFLAEVMHMPFNFNYQKVVASHRDPGSLFDFAQAEYRQMGLKMLSWGPMLSAELFATKPIKKLEDMKGLRWRTSTGTEVDKLTAKAFGMTLVNIPATDIFEGLQRGIIDVAGQSIPEYLEGKWYDAAPNLIIMDYKMAEFNIIMNLEVFNALPKVLQDILMQAAIQADKEVGDQGLKLKDDVLRQLKAIPKVNAYEMPPNEVQRIRDAVQTVYDAVAAKYGAKWTEYQKVRTKLL